MCVCVCVFVYMFPSPIGPNPPLSNPLSISLSFSGSCINPGGLFYCMNNPLFMNSKLMDNCLFFLYLLLLHNHFHLSTSSTVLLPLTHSLSTTKFNATHHLLKSTSARSIDRFHRYHQRQLSLPLSSGSDYTLSFTLGSSTISLYLDTGSDLVWFPCQPFTCILCESKPRSPTPPAKLSSFASPVPCSSPACAAAHSSIHSSSDLCAIAHCPLDSIEISECESFSCPPFYYAYADGSLIARLYRDSLSLPVSSHSFTIRNFTFGCAHTTLGEPIGVAGFGRGVLSLPAQLASFSPQLGDSFSYCLVSHSFDEEKVSHPSPLILGRYVNEKEKRIGGERVKFVYTQMLDNPKHPYFYSVGLEGISVGKKKIPAPESLRRVDRHGSGGMVVDSGTTFTMLPESLYESVVAEFDRRVGRINERARGIEERTGLGPCYYYGEAARVPSVALYFAGNGSSVVLPSRNYFYEFADGKRKVGCMMLMNGGDEKELSGGPVGTLGNYQQQGFEVVYELRKRRVGFAKRKCASLWESLNEG